ncbi:GntR family transcriptional regulator [Pigmentiphaga sp. H8]|uniref:GntR family transcriptional regulator n=1 Tax=Pigmentiphaga sp. H8 TaxID=2488560 RepID=UPI000F5A6C2D|nr:GntR family transcriptional regulator [Pigmentiphaga sp. H8]AZG08562.1 GntR family transcriptional regulator [Pigmentiphaga sp. H8]
MTTLTDTPSPSGPTLSTTLVEALRGSILGGTLLPGSKLRLDELREQYDVSLSPLREALTRLVSDGLIVTNDKKGYRVAPVSADDFREVTALRMNLEVMALGESIRRGDEHWEDALVAAYHRLSRLEAADRSGDKLPAWEKAHRTFHITLFSACGMPLLLRFCNTLHDLSDRYRRLFLASNSPDRNVPAEHEAIYQAALGRNAERACDILRQHLSRTGTNLLSVLPGGETGVAGR